MSGIFIFSIMIIEVFSGAVPDEFGILWKMIAPLTGTRFKISWMGYVGDCVLHPFGQKERDCSMPCLCAYQGIVCADGRPQIEMIDLSDLNLDDTIDLSSIPESVKWLSASRNRLNSIDLKGLNGTELVSLDIHSNHIEAMDLRELKGSHLLTLNVRLNPAIIDFPAFCEMTLCPLSLQLLYVSDHQFAGWSKGWGKVSVLRLMQKSSLCTLYVGRTKYNQSGYQYLNGRGQRLAKSYMVQRQYQRYLYRKACFQSNASISNREPTRCFLNDDATSGYSSVEELIVYEPSQNEGNDQI